MKIIKVFPNLEIQRYIAKKTCFPHIFTEQNYREFFSLFFDILPKKGLFLNTHVSSANHFVFNFSRISKSADFHHLNYFNYFPALRIELIKIS